MFGRAVHLRRAGHAWEGVELRGEYFGVAAYSQRPLWGRLWGSYCTAVLLLLSHPLTHKVLLEGRFIRLISYIICSVFHTLNMSEKLAFTCFSLEVQSTHTLLFQMQKYYLFSFEVLAPSAVSVGCR